MKNSIKPESEIQMKVPKKRNLIWGFIWLVLFLSFIAGCTLTQLPKSGESTLVYSPSPSVTPSQLVSQLPQSTKPLLHQPRTIYPTPKIDPVTPIPAPISNLQIPDETRLLVLLGTDNPSPFISRTDAIMLAFYNPRLAKVAFVSLPPEMFVYIPGYTMQRINIAYAIGEFPMLADTIEYNIGIRPDEYAVVHVDDFAWFVEELNGLDVDVFRDYFDYCGGIPAGNVHLQGGDVLCYAKFRDGWDIHDQAERQQQVVWRIFMRMISGGKLSDLENIYRTYKSVVQSNLNLPDLLSNIPLAIRLGQVERFGFFQPTFDMFTTWDLPGDVKATVLLPRGDRLIRLIQEAIDFTTIAVQSSDVILTLEYELTVSPTPTNTHTASPTFTATITRTATITPVTSPTRTLEGYPGPNATSTTAGYPGPQPTTTTNPGYP
jgi:LCP family protein required for cell wall assembly